jgi:putative flippase GtrA
MNTLVRWCKFNLVGAMGMAVQLGALALLNRRFAGHYLLASAASVELAVMHNLLWHLHYTWRDRRGEASRIQMAVRFHLTNGLVSIAGNLLLMRVFYREAHLPLIAANLLAIVCCSVINFNLGDRWAFAAG